VVIELCHSPKLISTEQPKSTLGLFNMINKKLLGITITILAIAMLITPTMAAPNGNAMHKVDVKQTSNVNVDYAGLTDYCTKQWGLSTNPYPDYLPLATGVKASYKIFTTQIGDDEYQGVSCNTYTEAYTVTGLIKNSAGTTIGYMMEIHQVYDAVWYLGDWGKDNARMNSGFSGIVDVHIHAYNTVTKTYTYYNAELNLDGFQSFNHQSIHLTIPDSRVSLLGTGYCDVLGNRDKN
jgi:hypothetical protein